MGLRLALAAAAAATAVSPATDQRWALEATIRAGDVPRAFKVTRGPALTNDAPLRCPSFNPDLSDVKLRAEAMSSLLQNAETGASVFSTTDIYASAHDERTAWKRTAQRGELRCIERALRASAGSGRLRITSSVATRTARIGERSISYRVTGDLTAGAVHIRTWFDVTTFARGRAEVSLMFVTVEHAPPGALKQALLARLDRRVRR